MSRNKENSPLPSATRANGSIFSLAKTPPSEDFFTDSLLDASRIPSPSPQKASHGKPRRALGNTRALQVARGSANTAHRSSSPRNAERRSSRRSQPLPALKRPKTLSPAGQQELITPPHSSHGLDITSPLSDLSSPPRGLTDVYQRIQDEEDLAATEGEMRDDADQDEIYDGQPEPVEELQTNEQRRPSSRQSQTSRGSTPVQWHASTDEDNKADAQDENLTQASGMSFLGELTDPNIAAKLTPHVMDHAKTRKKLLSYMNSKPIKFNTPLKPSEAFEQQNDWTTGSDPQHEKRPPGAFRYANLGFINGTGRTLSESNTIDSPPKVKAFSYATRIPPQPVTEEKDDDSEHTSDELRGIEKKFAASRASRILRSSTPKDQPSGIPIPDDLPRAVELNPSETAKHAKNEEAQDIRETTQDQAIEDEELTGSIASNDARPLHESIPSQNPVPATGKGLMNLWRRKAAEQRLQKTQSNSSQESSQIDWGEAAADVPLPSIEPSSVSQATPPNTKPLPSIREQKSADRLRRWENDFTGMSFQVSESPPVRTKSNVADYLREKEIEHLTKQAVTTNRLGEIREKDPRELHKVSRSPSINKQQLVEETLELTDDQLAEQIPDTPIVVYRSSSNSSTRNSDKREGSTHNRQSSHDQLQRLAKAMSTTPRSTPPPHITKDEITEEKIHTLDEQRTEDLKLDNQDMKDPLVDEEPSTKPHVAATPKITGAWTDTILPDTIKTVKQRENQPRYSQTPHVSAGGWVDTPLPSGHRQSSALAPMTIEEETEEISIDVAPGTQQAELQEQAAISEKKPYASQVQLPRSALSTILDQQKQRLISQDITTAHEDTLNLGDATIASLEDLMTLDENEITALIRMGAEQEALDRIANGEIGDHASAEAALLERLGIKLERLRTNIQVARKGLSKLEHQVSRPAESEDSQAQALIQSPKTESCAVCSPSDTTPSAFPMAYSTFTLPIPLLFHPQHKDQKRRFSMPRPTMLGWVTILLWTWYILESTMCELYSHPMHAERYTWPADPEPVFPYVLPTMLCRWMGISSAPAPMALLSPVLRILVAFWRVLGMWIGWTDGFVDDPRNERLLANATKAAMRMASAAVSEADGLDLSMNDDEFV